MCAALVHIIQISGGPYEEDGRTVFWLQTDGATLRECELPEVTIDFTSVLHVLISHLLSRFQLCRRFPRRALSQNG